MQLCDVHKFLRFHLLGFFYIFRSMYLSSTSSCTVKSLIRAVVCAGVLLSYAIHYRVVCQSSRYSDSYMHLLQKHALASTRREVEMVSQSRCLFALFNDRIVTAFFADLTCL